jgi:phosphocarrier protein FPr
LGANLLDHVRDGQTLVVDGSSGQALFQPTTAQIAAARQEQERRLEMSVASRATAAQWRGWSGKLRDGQRIPVLANVGTLDDARAAATAGAEGIGLLRTEFLFAQGATLPDEEEQARLYTTIIDALGETDGPVIVRTLDAGADKPLASLATVTGAPPVEANPALGVRGIRLQLAFRTLLATQFRALLLAAARVQSERPVDLQVMLPMVTTVEEVREAKTIMAIERAALLLVGLGVDELSMNPSSIPSVKAILAAHSLAEAQEFARQALQATKLAEVQQVIAQIERMSTHSG